MQVIRDPNGDRLIMIPALSQHGVHRCNVSGCNEAPNTILTDVSPELAPGLNAGICEQHYQEAKEKGKWAFKLDFV